MSEPLMTLADGAASLGLTTSALRTEIRKGRLTPIVVAGRYYVTRKVLADMVEACRVKPRGHGSPSSDIATGTDGGSSSIVDPSVAQDAASQTLQELKERSRRTSPASISRAARQPA